MTAGRRLALILLILYWMAIFAATHTPARRWPGGDRKTSDKVAHFSAFAGLTCLMGWAFYGRRRPAAAKLGLVFLIAAAYGVFDELTQAPIEGRTPELADWLADICGAAGGLFLYRASVLAAERLRPAPAPKTPVS
jgi:VanZ family protein